MHPGTKYDIIVTSGFDLWPLVIQLGEHRLGRSFFFGHTAARAKRNDENMKASIWLIPKSIDTTQVIHLDINIKRYQNIFRILDIGSLYLRVSKLGNTRWAA